MIKKILLIIGIIYVNFTSCYPQNVKINHDKYIIVLDVQQQFYSNGLMDSSAKAMVKNINAIIDICDPGKVIYIKAAGKMLSVSFKGISVVPIEAPGLDSNLKVVNNTVFTKIKGDAFTVDELCNYLQNNNARDIILVGILAEKCIYDTALGGKKRGYNINIVPEAILGKTAMSKEKVIKKMAKKGIKIMALKDIINAS
jgi:nicotinamidase-related amidase